MERRRIIQGAVLMTLANRPAWGQPACNQVISANTFASVTAGGVNSMSPGTTQAMEDLESALRVVTLDNGDACIINNNRAEEAPGYGHNKLNRQTRWFESD